MAVPRSLTFLRVGSGAQVLEVYLDPNCPFSGKISRALDEHVLPLITKGGKYEGKLSLVPRIYPQPFHYFSPVLSEVILAVGSKYPAAFWPYILAVYENQKTYFNVPSQSMTISAARDQLADLALAVLEQQSLLPAGPRSRVLGEIRDAVEVKAGKDGAINGGNEVTEMLKHGIKIGRQNGIHVTPTVLFDGLKEDSVSSSWGQKEWEEFLQKKMAQ